MLHKQQSQRKGNRKGDERRQPENKGRRGEIFINIVKTVTALKMVKINK